MSLGPVVWGVEEGGTAENKPGPRSLVPGPRVIFSAVEGGTYGIRRQVNTKQKINTKAHVAGEAPFDSDDE